MMIENKKASIVLVLKVLEKYSDEQHYLTQKEIIDKIKKEYGLELERKSVGNSIQLLIDLDYDICRGGKGGFALIDRSFNASEVKYLVDAIFSSKSISGKQAKELCDKISSSLSKYDQKSYDYLVKSTELNRTNNIDVLYNIEMITEAIRTNKWIGFKYLTYDEDGNPTERFDGYVYHASPCYLVNNYGRYYLLAYRYKYDAVTTWRVDNMKDVYVMNERERLDPTKLKEFKNYSNISQYLNDHIYLFDGTMIDAVVEVKEPKALGYIDDWFGNNAKIYKEGNALRASIRCNETAFFYWAMQYSEHIKIISPQSMIDRMTNAADNIIKEYKKVE